MNVTVVHRSDGSGTTSIFSDYLSKVSREWKEKRRRHLLELAFWLGRKGNPVAGLIQQTPEHRLCRFIYALQNKMPYGMVKKKG
jgi:phosphate transport system substrate-binding protein